MNWAKFIKEIASQKLSSNKNRLTFLATFGDCGELLIQDPKTTEGHLREIYKCFEEECPKLQTVRKGKKEVLREYLQDLYEIVEIKDHLSISTKEQNTTLSISNKTARTSTSLNIIGREVDHYKLEKVSNQHKIVLLKSASGVGKSTFARHFLETNFAKVVRVEMGLESGNVTPIGEKISQILRKEFNEQPSHDFQTNLEILKEKLSDITCPIGVLIDNLEPALDENFRFREKLRGYEDLLRILCDRDVCSFTLITSRRSLIAQRVALREYSLEGLSIAAWRQYFHDCDNGETSESLMQMCVAYNGNAKVMDILHGAIINRFSGNIEAYWNRYKDALLADTELETLISVEMDWLRNNQPDAYKLLCRMGCYRYQDIKTIPFEGLICLLWDIQESQRVLVVDNLSKSSLIEVKEEYYLHPAIRELALSRLKPDNLDWKASNINAAEFWTQSIISIETIEDALKAFKAYYHYLAINEYELACDVIVKTRNNTWEDNEPLGKTFCRLGWLVSIKLAIDQIINHVSSSANLSRIYSILGNVYWSMGEISKAIYSHEKSKKIAVNFSIKNIEIAALFDIGLCQIDIWEIQLAIKSFEKCIELAQYTNYEYYISQSYYCLSFLNSLLGFKEKSIDFIDKTFQKFNMTSYSAWSTGCRWLFLGRAYTNLFDRKSALDMFKIALAYAEERYYPQVKANAFNGLAIITRFDNDFSRSLLNHYEAIKILTTIGARCDLAESYFQLGLTYQAMGEQDQSETYKTKALELFEQMEAPKQIERVNQAFGENIQ